MSKYKVIFIKNTDAKFGYNSDMAKVGMVIEGNLEVHKYGKYLVVRSGGWIYHLDDLELVHEFSLRDIYE